MTAPDPIVEENDAVIGTAFRRSLLVLVVLGVAVGSSWLVMQAGRSTPVAEPPKAVVAAQPRKASANSIPEIPFTDITSSAGITFVHENGAYGDKLLPETMGGGCAFVDYDNDGDQDILLVNSSRWPFDPRPAPEKPATMALYQNDGRGQFVDVTQSAGLDVSFYGQGVAVGDYDGDGDADLFFSAVGLNHLYRNDGGRFVDVTAEVGVAGHVEQWSTSCGWLDYDGDKDLDLFVLNYVVWSKQFDLDQNFQLTGGGRAYGRPQNFPGCFPYLYRNDGGKFVDVAGEAGLHITNPATGVPAAKSLGVTFVDLDVDGWLDIVVANDTVQNLLFHNQQDGTFQELATVAGMAFDNDGNARGAMGIDAGHFRNSAAMGVVIGNFANEMTALYVSENGELQFVDEAVATGLGPQTRLELTFGTLLLDLDLDGRLDIVAANGHLEEDINRVQPSQFYEQPPHLFWNCGPDEPTEFVPVPVEKCGVDLRKRMVGRGASTADIDGDGDLDVLLAASGRSPRLLRNEQKLGHHWLRVRLQGTQSNTMAIGARLELHAGGQVQRARVCPTRSYLSQTELPVTFGLGEAESIDRLVISWPSGIRQEVTAPQIDQLLVVTEPSAP
jgi:enediyne biosynthesis protein E4